MTLRTTPSGIVDDGWLINEPGPAIDTDGNRAVNLRCVWPGGYIEPSNGRQPGVYLGGAKVGQVYAMTPIMGATITYEVDLMLTDRDLCSSDARRCVVLSYNPGDTEVHLMLDPRLLPCNTP